MTDPEIFIAADPTIVKLKWFRAMLALVLALCASGCSVVMSAHRQSYKGDPSVIQVGANRSHIENTLGAADFLTTLDNGKTKAIYRIDPDAVSSGTKTAETGFNLVADVLTLTFWEVVAAPIEWASKDDVVTYVLIYGSNNVVESVDIMKAAKKP